jgi:outer membrane lipoprotein-sorting protein
VPKLFTDDLLQRANDGENRLKNVITGDETWFYDYDIETKQQSSHCMSPASPCPNKA